MRLGVAHKSARHGPSLASGRLRVNIRGKLHLHVNTSNRISLF